MTASMSGDDTQKDKIRQVVYNTDVIHSCWCYSNVTHHATGVIDVHGADVTQSHEADDRHALAWRRFLTCMMPMTLTSLSCMRLVWWRKRHSRNTYDADIVDLFSIRWGRKTLWRIECSCPTCSSAASTVRTNVDLLKNELNMKLTFTRSWQEVGLSVSCFVGRQMSSITSPFNPLP